MNKVIIPEEINNKDYLFLVNKLLKNKSKFIISSLIINFAKNIENRGDRQIILYVLYKIITDIKLDLDISPIPKNGLEFNDYNNDNPLGIFHCHLNNDKVLIWYVEKINDKLNIKIEYIDHPQDNYESVLKKIYNSPYGYNMNINEYFKNYKSETYLKDSFVFTWTDFIKNEKFSEVDSKFELRISTIEMSDDEIKQRREWENKIVDENLKDVEEV